MKLPFRVSRMHGREKNSIEISLRRSNRAQGYFSDSLPKKSKRLLFSFIYAKGVVLLLWNFPRIYALFVSAYLQGIRRWKWSSKTSHPPGNVSRLREYYKGGPISNSKKDSFKCWCLLSFPLFCSTLFTTRMNSMEGPLSPLAGVALFNTEKAIASIEMRHTY